MQINNGSKLEKIKPQITRDISNYTYLYFLLEHTLGEYIDKC